MTEVKIWREDSARGQKDGRAKLSEVIRKIDEKIASLCKVQTGVLDLITELELANGQLGVKVALLKKRSAGVAKLSEVTRKIDETFATLCKVTKVLDLLIIPEMHERAEVTKLRELLKEVKILREDSERGQNDGVAKL